MANDGNDGSKRGAKELRLELRKKLSGLSSKKKLDALIDAADARRLVRTMPSEELYFAIADVGLADATEIVQLASPGQFKTFVDLGAWEKDRLDSHGLLTWLRAARGDEDEEFLKKVRGLDPEVLHFMFKEFVVVHDLEENPDVNPDGPTMETPEGRYLLELKVEGAEEAALRSLLRDLIAENPFESVRMLESTRWEFSSELEEISLRFRTGRLADLGFPAIDEAMAVFTYVQVEGPKPVEGGAALAAPRERVDHLNAAVAGLDEEERDALEDELRYLANSVLVAEAANPGDLYAVRRITEMTRDYLSLGLEHLTGGDPSRALEMVREHPLRHVFRIGFSQTLKLKFRADRLAKSPLGRIEEVYLVMPEEGAALEALRRKRPLRAMTRVEGAEPMPFRSQRELLESNAILDRAERQNPIFSELLGGTPEAAKEAIASLPTKLVELGTEQLFLTAVVIAVVGGGERIRSLKAAELEAFSARVLEDGAVGPVLRSDAVELSLSALAPRLPGELHEEARRMVKKALESYAEQVRSGLPGALPLQH